MKQYLSLTNLLRLDPHEKVKVKVLDAQPCPTLCDPTDCRPPGSSVHGILQATLLEWLAIPFSRGSSQPATEPRSLALQADSLPSSPQGSPPTPMLNPNCPSTLCSQKQSKVSSSFWRGESSSMQIWGSPFCVRLHLVFAMVSIQKGDVPRRF